MNAISLITIISLVVAAGLFVLVFIWRKAKDRSIAAVQKQMDQVSTLTPNNGSEIGCDLELLDENGFKILESREIPSMPARAHRVESSESAIGRVKHMAADLFRGATSIPNKTVEVVFRPEIQQGLTDGAYTLMRTKSGETLVDAVDSSGSIVGKGRLIQGGKARQLIGGAFQLVSIAVAQSHLADIERSLSTLKDSISEIIERQENEDKARITGAFDYLCEISKYMKEFRCPDELSSQKRHAIESIIKESYSWRNKLEEDMGSLINQISGLHDLDTFGTGNTYERLNILIEKIEPLLKRRQLFLNLASAISFVTIYLDPTQREFSKMDAKNDNWKKLIEKFRGAVLDKVSSLMGEAVCNSKETLQLRRDKLTSLSLEYQRTAIDQQTAYISLQNSLENSMTHLIDPNGSVHVAISFDGRGEVDAAAIL